MKPDQTWYLHGSLINIVCIITGNYLSYHVQHDHSRIETQGRLVIKWNISLHVESVCILRLLRWAPSGLEFLLYMYDTVGSKNIHTPTGLTAIPTFLLFHYFLGLPTLPYIIMKMPTFNYFLTTSTFFHADQVTLLSRKTTFIAPSWLEVLI